MFVVQTVDDIVLNGAMYHLAGSGREELNQGRKISKQAESRLYYSMNTGYQLEHIM